jgi:predicted N-acyltransferase
MSNDTWMVLSDVERALFEQAQRPPEQRPGRRRGDDTVLAVAQRRALSGMLALSGMAAESMVRDAGWTMMDIGRRIERGLALTALLMELIDDFCRQQDILSCNFLYVDPQWQPLAEAAGCAAWVNQQSLWTNPGHGDFNAYLASFNANQRRNIKRERQAVTAAGLTVTPLEGEAIPPSLVERMHGFYAQHCSRWGAWGSKYLSEAFFAALAQDPALRRSLVLFSAHRGDPLQPVAMSLCVHSEGQLWGRYWGSDEEIDCLHFEVCYYAPTAWAIERGIRHFDPGAGGSHKRRRGFVAQPRVSLHRWVDRRFEAILRNWLPGANAEMALEIEAINAELPFTAAYDPPHA